MVVIPRLPQLPVTQSLVLCFFVRTFIQDIELERKITVVRSILCGPWPEHDPAGFRALGM